MNTKTLQEFITEYNMPLTGTVLRQPSDDGVKQCKYMDAVFLSTLAKNIDGDILEIGTSFGKGTADLARNSAHTIYTVNPLPEQLPETLMITHRIGVNEIGKCYRDEGLTNVVQIYENSKDLLFSFPVKMAFVDGNHTSEFAYADAVKSYAVLEVGGFLLWHDANPDYREQYRWIDTTMSGMERFCSEYQYTPIHLAGSWCSYIQKRLEYEI